MSPYLVSLIKRMLEPLITQLIKYGVGYKIFDAIAKNVFVSVAAKNYGLRSKDTNISRIALMTDLTRKDAAAIKNKIINEKDNFLEMNTMLAKLFDIWLNDDIFLDKNNIPRPLKYKGESPSFCDLVGKSKLDAPPKAIYIELERLYVIEKDSNGLISLRNFKNISQANEEILVSRLKDLLSNS